MSDPEKISARQLAGEQRNERRRQQAIRRTPAVVVGLAVLLTLAAGIAYVVDQRHLRTPEGVTRAWVQAALTSDCERYGKLSTPANGRVVRLTADQCQLVKAAVATGAAKTAMVNVSGVVELPSARATADVTISVAGFPQRASRVELSKTSGRWLVLRTPSTCALLTCP